MEQVKDIKSMEMLVQSRKEEHLRTVQNLAKERYENQIRAHEDARNKLEDEIEKLESREKELIDKVKRTQTFRQLCLEDLDRIIKNEEPTTMSINDANHAKASKRFK
jgi:hypothetical protein